MDKTTITLIAACVGAIAAMVVALLSHFLTRQRETLRHERELQAEYSRWLRENRQEAYHNAIKYLFRVAAGGAKLEAKENPTLPHDGDPEWYKDIAETNAWLSTVHYYCSVEKYDLIGETSTEFSNLSNMLLGFRPTGTYAWEKFGGIVSKNGEFDFQEFMDYWNQVECDISNAARYDLGALDAVRGNSNEKNA